MRLDNVAVELLEHQHEQLEPDDLHRINQQYQDTARNSSDERTEERYEICDSADYCKQHGVRHSHNEAAYRHRNKNYQRVHEVRYYVALENRIGSGAYIKHPLTYIVLQEREKDLFCLSQKPLLAEQKIYRNDKSDHDILQTRQQPRRKLEYAA